MSNVKGKIRKLLSVTKDPAASVHEIDSYLKKAGRLMHEHRLSEADLSDSFEDPNEDPRNDRNRSLAGIGLYRNLRI